MNHPFKVFLLIITAILLYTVLKVLVVLVALAVCAGAIALLVHAYKMFCAGQGEV